MKNNSSPPDFLTPQDLQVKSPLQLEWLGSEMQLGLEQRADARIRLSFRGESKTFIVNYTKRWTAVAIEAAIRQVKKTAELNPSDLPLVVLPYMSDDAFHLLAESEVSGLDVVGNGLIAAGDWLMLFSGTPNPYKNPQLVKSPYSGKSALVARTLLACPVVPTAEALRAEIQQRGGNVSQPVVSRALKAFREDLIVGSRAGHGIVLLQPEKLLDRLTEQWKSTVEKWRAGGNTVVWSGRVEGSPTEVLPRMFQQPRIKRHEAIMTGLTSTVQRTHLTVEATQYLYSEAVGPLLDDVQATSTRRFPNLEIWLPPDEAVFFDAVTDEHRVEWASPLQTYLELVTGDARLQQTAVEFRTALLEEAEEKKAVLLAQDGKA
ncbi:hypothetical protein ACI3L1_10660 [Deinococcus sp. SM5_A1]|uniref:hypothetical protein n=1 Tax=Deinococcus sp. SM5_A1 TaxID=3379094 RepID=UPI00385F5B88